MGNVPGKYDTWVSFALLPPRWQGSESEKFGLFAPLTALIRRDDAGWMFELEVGAQVTVAGEFRVWNFPPLPAVEINPYLTAPADNPYILVDEIWDPAARRRSEADRKEERKERAAAREAAEARKTQRAEGAALTADEEQARAALIKKTRKMLDSAGVTEKRVRRQMTDRSLVDAGFPTLRDDE
jgi:hypothetical protein